MKRIAVSVGLVAIGASAVSAAPADSLSSTQAAKAWNVSATLRGFYDDNYTTASTGGRSSAGFEISPSVGLNLPLEQTLITGSYTYSYKWFGDRDRLNEDPADQSHQFNIDVTHAFSEKLNAEVSDTFVSAQEPQLVDPTLGLASRAQGDNIRNTGTASVNAELTRQLGVAFSYQNNYIDYENEGGNQFTNSLSGLLDRIEHTITSSLRFHVKPETTVSLSYIFGAGCYTGDEAIAASGPIIFRSNSRNYYAHSGNVGLEHVFNESLSANVSVGATYTDHYNTHESEVSPSAVASLSYTYLPGSSLTVGFRHAINATDQVAPDASGHITQDQESSTVFVDLVHKITPSLTAKLNGTVQDSTFRGGSADGQSELFYMVGVNLSYAFNQHLSTEIGYNYDKVDSDLAGRGYDRNYAYIGLTASY